MFAPSRVAQPRLCAHYSQQMQSECTKRDSEVTSLASRRSFAGPCTAARAEVTIAMFGGAAGSPGEVRYSAFFVDDGTSPKTSRRSATMIVHTHCRCALLERADAPPGVRGRVKAVEYNKRALIATKVEDIEHQPSQGYLTIITVEGSVTMRPNEFASRIPKYGYETTFPESDTTFFSVSGMCDDEDKIKLDSIQSDFSMCHAFARVGERVIYLNAMRTMDWRNVLRSFAARFENADKSASGTSDGTSAKKHVAHSQLAKQIFLSETVRLSLLRCVKSTCTWAPRSNTTASSENRLAAATRGEDDTTSVASAPEHDDEARQSLEETVQRKKDEMIEAMLGGGAGVGRLAKGIGPGGADAEALPLGAAAASRPAAVPAQAGSLPDLPMNAAPGTSKSDDASSSIHSTAYDDGVSQGEHGRCSDAAPCATPASCGGGSRFATSVMADLARAANAVTKHPLGLFACGMLLSGAVALASGRPDAACAAQAQQDECANRQVVVNNTVQSPHCYPPMPPQPAAVPAPCCCACAMPPPLCARRRTTRRVRRRACCCT